MDPARALATLGGAARWDDLLKVGVTEWSLRRARETGAVIMLCRGTYALPATSPARVAAASLRGQVSCVSACAEWKLRQLDPPEAVHIAVPRGRHITGERLERLGLAEVHRGSGYVAGGSQLSLRDALDTSALCTTPLQQLVMVDAALESGRLAPAEIGLFRCGDAPRRTWLARTANAGAMSVSESVARASLEAAGFRARIQVRRRGVGDIDIAVGKRFFIEVDGFEEHSKWSQFSKDRRRDRQVSAERDWTLRYTYWDVVEDPRWFVYDVARIIRKPVQRRFEARIAWLTARPPTALNRI